MSATRTEAMPVPEGFRLGRHPVASPFNDLVGPFYEKRDGEWRIDARRFETDVAQIFAVHESMAEER